MAQSDQTTASQPAATAESRAPPGTAKSRAQRPMVIGVAAVLVVATLLGYWWTHRTAAPEYLTGEVTRGAVSRTVTASGTVNPMTTVQVGTYVSGVIQTLSCDFNTQVKAGQLCAKIDPRPYQTIVDQEGAALDTARAQLAKDQANLQFSQVIYDRDVDLLNRKIVSQETVDTANNALIQARAQVALDQSTIAQRVATLNAAKVNLDYTNIISPVNGTVVSRNVTQGQTVAASFQTPTLFLIATDLTQMQVDTNVSESDIGSVAVGDKVLFTVEAYPEQTFTGEITQVRQAPLSVQNVITYDAVVGVPNPDMALKPGMTAAVRIVTAERDDVLRVPNAALRFTPHARGEPKGAGPDAAQNAAPPSGDTRPFGGSRAASQGAAASGGARAASDGERHAVYVLKDGRPTRIPVRTGLDDDTNTEITGGDLAAGDVVIVGVRGPAGGPASGAPPGLGGTTPRIPRL
jgi:HlyD family secretion protein